MANTSPLRYSLLNSAARSRARYSAGVKNGFVATDIEFLYCFLPLVVDGLRFIIPSTILSAWVTAASTVLPHAARSSIRAKTASPFQLRNNSPRSRGATREFHP